MSRFGPDPRHFFDTVYQAAAPWDVGGPQSDLFRLLTTHPPADPILDVGCGSGDLAITLAHAGAHVIGVDFAATAIARARAKAARLAPDVSARLQFAEGDALHPSRLGAPFGAIVDSGFFHLFEPEEGARFAGEMATTLVPGGRYYLLAFATEFDVPHTPRAVSQAELEALFTPARGWRTLELRAATFASRIAPVPAVAGCFERVGG